MCSNEDIRESIQQLDETVRKLGLGVGTLETRMSSLTRKIYDVADSHEAFASLSRMDRLQMNDRIHTLETVQHMTPEAVKATLIEALDARHVVTQDGIVGAIFHSIQEATRWAAMRTMGLIVAVATIVTLINHLATFIHWFASHVLF